MQTALDWKQVPTFQYAQTVDDALKSLYAVTAKQLDAQALVIAAQKEGYSPWKCVVWIRDTTEGLV